MPETLSSWTVDGKGLELNSELLRAAGWYAQSSSRYHYGLPRKRGLWVYEVKPFEQCRHHPVKLFLLVQTDPRHRIRTVKTMVCQSFLDGSYEELGVPFNQFDLLQADEALLAALTPAAQEELSQRRSRELQEPLALLDLQALIGTYVDLGPGQALVEKFGLGKALDVLGEGVVFATSGKPLEIHGNHAERVRTVLLTPRAIDRIEPGGTATLTRSAIRGSLGSPSGTGRSPNGADRFESPNCVTLVTYDESGNAAQISIMSPEAAP